MPIQITPRVELATRLTAGSEAPEQAIRAVFSVSLENLEETLNLNLDSVLRVHLWNKVKIDKIAITKDKLISEFCARILNSFTDDEIVIMLQEHKNTSEIVTPALSIRLGLIRSAHYHHILARISETGIAQIESVTTMIIQELVKKKIIQGVGNVRPSDQS